MFNSFSDSEILNKIPLLDIFYLRTFDHVKPAHRYSRILDSDPVWEREKKKKKFTISIISQIIIIKKIIYIFFLLNINFYARFFKRKYFIF